MKIMIFTVEAYAQTVESVRNLVNDLAITAMQGSIPRRLGQLPFL